MLILTGTTSVLQAQNIKVGVRAGADFTSLHGPLEANEEFSIGQGFHFGFNVSRYLTPDVSIRAELLYQQKGYTKRYNGNGYYPIKETDGSLKFIEGDVDYILEVSNAYVALPITFHYQPVRQIEVFAGLSPAFLINPIGNGNINFVSKENPDDLFFRQNFAYRYYQDEIGTTAESLYLPQVFCGEDIVTIPGAIGAYYFFDSELENERSFRWFDLSATIGAQFYINKSFYIGTRFEYSFFDLTNGAVDTSIESISDTGSFVFRNDIDRNLGLQVSVGFKF